MCLHNLHVVIQDTESLFEVHQFALKFTYRKDVRKLAQIGMGRRNCWWSNLMQMNNVNGTKTNMR